MWAAHFHFFTSVFLEFQKELLVEYKGDTTDLLHFGLCCGVLVDKVCCDGYGQFPSKLFATESCIVGLKKLSH